MVFKRFINLLALCVISIALSFGVGQAENTIALDVYAKNDQTKTVDEASRGDIIFIKSTYQNSVEKTLKMNIWITKNGTTEVASNFVLKKTEMLPAGKDTTVTFNWDTNASAIGGHLIRVKIFDPVTHQQVGAKKESCLEIYEATHEPTGACSASSLQDDEQSDSTLDTDQTVTEMESDQNGIAISYPDKFIRNESTAVSVKTTNPAIKFVKIFVSRTDRVDQSESWTENEICPKIASAPSIKNCEICQPVKLTCADGICGEAKFAVDQLGKHRLVAVGLTIDTGCQNDYVLGINNEPIIDVVDAVTFLSSEGEIADEEGVEDIELEGGSESITDLPSLLYWIVNVFLMVPIGLWVFISFVIGGFMFITADGNEEQIKRAKRVMSAGVLGAVLAVLAYAIVTIVVKILNDVFA